MAAFIHIHGLWKDGVNSARSRVRIIRIVERCSNIGRKYTIHFRDFPFFLPDWHTLYMFGFPRRSRVFVSELSRISPTNLFATLTIHAAGSWSSRDCNWPHGAPCRSAIIAVEGAGGVGSLHWPMMMLHHSIIQVMSPSYHDYTMRPQPTS